MSKMDEERIVRCFEAISRFRLSDDLTAQDLRRVEQRITDYADEQKTGRRDIWTTIMESRIMKLAAAAVIVVAVLVGIRQFGVPVDGTSVAWANVARKMETIDSFTCRKRETQTSSPTQQRVEFLKGKESLYWCSAEYGTKSEHYRDGKLTVRSYRLRKTKELVAVFPPEKTYNRLRLSDEALSEMEQENPRQIVRRFLASDYKPLGRDTIDGIRVEGVEVKDPQILTYPVPAVQDFAARLWADVKRQLPVRLEVECKLVGSSVWNTTVTDQFQWNVELGAGDFEPNIPAGYVPGAGQFGAITQQK